MNNLNGNGFSIFFQSATQKVPTPDTDVEQTFFVTKRVIFLMAILLKEIDGIET